MTPLIESAADALAVTLHETGFVDLDRIAEILGRSRDETIAELGDHIFLDPQLTIEGIETLADRRRLSLGPDPHQDSPRRSARPPSTRAIAAMSRRSRRSCPRI